MGNVQVDLERFNILNVLNATRAGEAAKPQLLRQ